jgi:Na+/phosphate symporter
MLDRDETKKYLQYMISHCESLLKFSDMIENCYPFIGKNMDKKSNNDFKNQIKLMSAYCNILLENLYK